MGGPGLIAEHRPYAAAMVVNQADCDRLILRREDSDEALYPIVEDAEVLFFEPRDGVVPIVDHGDRHQHQVGSDAQVGLG